MLNLMTMFLIQTMYLFLTYDFICSLIIYQIIIIVIIIIITSSDDGNESYATVSHLIQNAFVLNAISFIFKFKILIQPFKIIFILNYA
jgi:hypothetical protein